MSYRKFPFILLLAVLSLTNASLGFAQTSCLSFADSIRNQSKISESTSLLQYSDYVTYLKKRNLDPDEVDFKLTRSDNGAITLNVLYSGRQVGFLNTVLRDINGQSYRWPLGFMTNKKGLGSLLYLLAARHFHETEGLSIIAPSRGTNSPEFEAMFGRFRELGLSSQILNRINDRDIHDVLNTPQFLVNTNRLYEGFQHRLR